MTEPVRPPQLPPDAAYDAEHSHWLFAERNDAGELHGAYATYGAAGSPILRGTYVSGRPDGIWSRFTAEAPDAEPLRACCVPPGARELRTRFRAGVLLDETFYDARGRPLCEDGTPWPERQPGIPETASYEQSSGRFLDRHERANGVTTLRYFRVDGALEEELELDAGRIIARRRFDTAAREVEALAFDEQGAPHGRYVARFPHGDGPYDDARIREVRGEYSHGESVGTWALVDQEGATLTTVQLGEPLDRAALLRVAGIGREDRPEPGALWAEAETRTHSPREAVALAARALARDGDGARFARFVAERGAPLRAEAAARRAEAAVTESPSASGLLGALLLGAAPAIILRTLATSLPGHAPAALDYFDAALVLAPDQAMAVLARGLLCVEHGDPCGALEAAAAVEREEALAAGFLRDFVRVAYPSFDFAPARDGVTASEEELAPLDSEQPLAAVRHTIAVYATRLALVRRELERRAGGTPSWLPPDTTALLPDGLLELRRYTVRIEDEGDDGPEVSEVAVDETLPLDESTRRLLVIARSDWSALGWLCWSTGLDTVALPDRLTARADFAAAAHQATVRCWRAHDRVRTTGLVALARKVAGFTWEGMSIDEVPAHLGDVVAAQYLEVRAQFLWQLFPQNQSPFQSDLRQV